MSWFAKKNENKELSKTYKGKMEPMQKGKPELYSFKQKGLDYY